MGSPDVEYKMSHQQNWMFNQMAPYFAKLFGGGGGRGGGPWKVPKIDKLMPTKDWFESLSPEVMEGIWAPWHESANQMKEFMGARGQVGGQGSDYSGSFADASGRLFADAGQQVGMQAWQMTAPAQQARWQAELQRRMAPMSLLGGGMQSSLPTGFVSPSPWQTGIGGLGALGSLFGGVGMGASGMKGLFGGK